MKRSIVVSSILLFAAVLLVSPAGFAANRATEKVHISFDDGKEWKEGFTSTDSASTSFVEYVPKGEAPSVASEKVTVQMFSAFRPGVTPTTYTEGLKVSSLKRHPNADWNTIRTGGDDMMYEIKFSDVKGVTQQEIGRVMIKNGKFYIISYLSRKGPLAAEKREAWIKILDSVTVAE